MEPMLEIALQFLGEFLLELLGEILRQAGAEALTSVFERHPPRVIALVCSPVWGGIAGGCSLLFLPHPMVAGHAARLAAPIVIPVLCGICAMLIRRRLSADRSADAPAMHFAQAFLFTFAMTLIRFRLVQ